MDTIYAGGARGDNRTEDTAAVAAALAACSGGTVLLPAGRVFLLRPIELPSHTTLLLEGDIQAWLDYRTWPNSTVRYCTITPYESKKPLFIQKKESLLHALNSTGITIRGGGTVHGSGENWWSLFHKDPKNWHNCRPSLLELGVSTATKHGTVENDFLNTDATFSGFTLENSPWWSTSFRGTRNLVIDNVKVTTPCGGYPVAPNTDGFNVGYSDGVLITNSYVRNGDDCVPLFQVKNVTVRNITCECGNGLVPCIWPPSSEPGQGGTTTNVLFDGARMIKSSMGIAIKSLASFVGSASNVTWQNIVLEGVKQGVMLNVYGQSSSDDETARGSDAATDSAKYGVARFENIRIINVSGTVDSPGKMMCDATAACEGIIMKNVQLTVSGGDNYTCSNVHGTATDCSPQPCLEKPKPKPQPRREKLAKRRGISCTSNLDCSLNGVCSNGVCVCDAPWKDSLKEACSLLDVLPHPDDYVPAYGGGPTRRNTAWEKQSITSWGGNIVRGQEPDPKYHLFVSTMDEGKGLGSWGTQSRIDHAVADDPMHQFTFVSTALPKFAHNASPLKAPNGSFVLFHVGRAGGAANDSSTSCFAHVSESVDGPWRALGNGLKNCNNPAPVFLANGSTLVLCSVGGYALYHTSDLFHGHGWTKTLDLQLPPSWSRPRPYGHGKAYEDPFLWQDKRGNLHMLHHLYDFRNGYPPNPAAPQPIQVSAHAFSAPPFLEWHYNVDAQPYNAWITFQNGTTQNFSTWERPHLLFDPKTRAPTHLINGVQPYYNGPRGACDGCQASGGSSHACASCKSTPGLDYTYTLVTKLNVT